MGLSWIMGWRDIRMEVMGVVVLAMPVAVARMAILLQMIKIVVAVEAGMVATVAWVGTPGILGSLMAGMVVLRSRVRRPV